MELTGRSLGHYRVHEEISRGGMGVVYRATDTKLNRDVALKVLPQGITHSDEVRRRFLQEAQAASALEHPHIAVVHGADEVDGVAYIAMELIRGEKLSDLIARQRPAPARALELAAEIAAGLARAHDRGIVHRDLKPSNVMVTDEGHAKIIDFGIAKLIESSADAAAMTRTSDETGAGVVKGTMIYMSPEQARGGTLDQRSDIFSFGIVLHEMLAGEPPFRGKTGIETASAILHQAAPRLPALGPAVIAEASADIQRIVDKCLAKDPADRYQGMKDVVVDLRAARRRLDTHSQTVVTTAPRTLVPTWGWVAGGVAVAIGAAALLISDGGSSDRAAVPGESGKPSVAVLYFDNTTGDKELDWMRTGITEMVVTDLSQSQDIEVVATDRLYGILAELRRQDDRVMTPEVISAVAERTGVDRVLVGSYVRAGEAIRINVRLQDAKTGRIESSERVEGPNAAALFSMVDELSKRIRTTFAGWRADARLLTAPANAASDRSVGDVTTSSIEAYRVYAEAVDLHARGRYTEAVPLYERALAIDPSFAMAHAKLAVVEGNLGHSDRRDRHVAEALKLADRLTPRDRFYIEGIFHTGSPSAYGKAIAAYKKCLEVDATFTACRNNLGMLYLQVNRERDAVETFEPMVRRGGANALAHANLVIGYIGSGELQEARASAEAYVSQHPEIPRAHLNLGLALLAEGRTDEALRELARARVLGATDPNTSLLVAVAQILREDWGAADQTARGLLDSPDETGRFFGATIQWTVTAFHGRGADAAKWAQQAAATYKSNASRTAAALRFVALTLLDRGQVGPAVDAAARAVALSRDTGAEGLAAGVYAYALATAGRLKEADAAIAPLTERRDAETALRDSHDLGLARGLAALGRGDAAGAVAPLQAAAAALPPRMGNVSTPAPHLRTWSALGRALLESGKPAEALPWFRQIADSGHEHVFEAIEFVRSFYFLGRIYEQQGDMAKARESYARFVKYWKDGDLDRNRVAEAMKKIGS